MNYYLNIPKNLLLKIIQIYEVNAKKGVEVQWLGEVSTEELKNEKHFNLVDIHIPPQSQTAVTVRTEGRTETEYILWISKLGAEVAKRKNKLRLHAHTHPNMSTHPSGTDIDNILDLVELSGFQDWVQLIYNASFSNFLNNKDLEFEQGTWCKVYGKNLDENNREIKFIRHRCLINIIE